MINTWPKEYLRQKFDAGHKAIIFYISIPNQIYYITDEDSLSSKWLLNAFLEMHPYSWTQNSAIHNQTLLKEDFN